MIARNWKWWMRAGAGLCVAAAVCSAACTNDRSAARSDDGSTKNAGVAADQQPATGETEKDVSTEDKVVKSDAEWRKILTPEQYHVMREKGTEAPRTGKYDTFFEDGEYKCGACGAVLFKSDSKYNSGCGWPAFSAPSDKKMITETADYSHGMTRTEVTCSRCGAHLGHVFNDGPAPTGVRYCINSASLKFQKKSEPAAATKEEKP